MICGHTCIMVLKMKLFMQDPLQNFFSQPWALGCQNVHATAVNAIQSICLLLIGKNAEDLVSHPTVQSTPEVHMLGNNESGPLCTPKQLTADVSDPVQQEEVDDQAAMEEV